jgi:DNA-binding transcriptional LysR family regulator
MHQLGYFVAVAEEANFTRAAARVHVAQPGISVQIRRLEKELGELLFDRSGRTVRLTEAGEAFLPHARAVLEAVDSGRRAVEEQRVLLAGQVAIGMMAALPGVDIAGLLAEFHCAHPRIDVTLTARNSEVILDAVRTGELSAGIVGLPGRPPSGLGAKLIAIEELVIATATDDVLASRTSAPLRILRDRPLISLPPASGLRRYLDAACAKADFEPRIAFEVSDLHLLAELAGQGLGVAVLPKAAAEAYPGPLHILTVTRPRLQGRVALVWRTDGPQSPATRAFLDVARRRFATLDA